MKRRTDMNMRRRKSKRNIILNSSIVVVFALILVVGGNMVFGSDTTSEDEQNSAGNEEEDIKITEDESEDQQSETASSDQEENNNQGENESEQRENAIDRLEVEDGNESGNDENNDDSQQGREENESQDENGINLDNIGEPIGTSQTGEHTSSYDEGTVDWNEKIEAIQMVTGLDDSMTLWRLASDGGPQQSVGKVSPDGVQDWMYVVNLEWVDQEGWKVTNVDRQSR
ncbi:YrrS family protein [Lentibacillus sp. CBA3610]|uniref:YrrS family protein n=1 Tax=Lentibacillus sp. CBA3610 TaxID=2518176 RepID=UPI00159636CF|nr:YrrS family protein [Lentibacillus sp. CBA3610]QKY68700.1 DUF1510 family protein [Lentibacillus sp. CBA3610]